MCGELFPSLDDDESGIGDRELETLQFRGQTGLKSRVFRFLSAERGEFALDICDGLPQAAQFIGQQLHLERPGFF